VFFNCRRGASERKSSGCLEVRFKDRVRAQPDHPPWTEINFPGKKVPPKRDVQKSRNNEHPFGARVRKTHEVDHASVLFPKVEKDGEKREVLADKLAAT